MSSLDMETHLIPADELRWVLFSAPDTVSPQQRPEWLSALLAPQGTLHNLAMADKAEGPQKHTQK